MKNKYLTELSRRLSVDGIQSAIKEDRRLDVFLHDRPALPLRASGLHEDFRLLADFGGAVLAGQERGNGLGYQFVTWVWAYERQGVCHGHYYEDDFQSAKQDFAVRSGLISKAQLFSPEELTELYRATNFLLEEGPEPEEKPLKAIQEARTKIEYTVPDLQTRLEQTQSQEPQMNL